MPHDIGGEEDGRRPSPLVGIDNEGSTARDVCAIERNFLSHTRLALLLSLLSSSILLKARLSGRGLQADFVKSALPLGSLFFLASLATFSVGWWAYEASKGEMKKRKGFVGGFRVHEIVLCFVAALVASTCVYLLVIDEDI